MYVVRRDTGKLIDPNWVLTAAHVAQLVSVSEAILVAGNIYRIAQIVLHPAWSPDHNGDHNNLRELTDLALIELAEPVTDVEPVPLYEGQDELGQVVIFVGRGHFGTGHTGPTDADGHVRAATNRVEMAKNQWLVFRFDLPSTATDLEGISGPQDSGGPAFIETDESFFLAGVSCWQDSRQQGRQGLYGVWEYYARVSNYIDWIRKRI